MNFLSLAPLSYYALIGIGFVLIALEISLNSFYIMWFGVGFCIVGILEYFFSFSGALYQITTACVLSLILLFALKQKVKNFIQKTEKEIKDNFLNEKGYGVIKHGMVKFKGTMWEIEPKNLQLQDGDEVEIIGTKENKAIIKAPKKEL